MSSSTSSAGEQSGDRHWVLLAVMVMLYGVQLLGFSITRNAFTDILAESALYVDEDSRVVDFVYLLPLAAAIVLLVYRKWYFVIPLSGCLLCLWQPQEKALGRLMWYDESSGVIERTQILSPTAFIWFFFRLPALASVCVGGFALFSLGKSRRSNLTANTSQSDPSDRQQEN